MFGWVLINGYIYIYGEKCERVVKGEGCWSGVGIHGLG